MERIDRLEVSTDVSDCEDDERKRYRSLGFGESERAGEIRRELGGV
jgi:hypothetical protein